MLIAARRAMVVYIFRRVMLIVIVVIYRLVRLLISYTFVSMTNSGTNSAIGIWNRWVFVTTKTISWIVGFHVLAFTETWGVQSRLNVMSVISKLIDGWISRVYFEGVLAFSLSILVKWPFLYSHILVILSQDGFIHFRIEVFGWYFEIGMRELGLSALRLIGLLHLISMLGLFKIF